MRLDAADLDGDGDMDVLSGNTWYANLGGGLFAPAQDVERPAALVLPGGSQW